MSAVDTDLTVQISISLRQRFSEHLFCNVIILSLMKQNDHWVKEKVHLKTHKNSQPLQSALGNKSSRHFKNHEKLFLIPSKIIIRVNFHKLTDKKSRKQTPWEVYFNNFNCRCFIMRTPQSYPQKTGRNSMTLLV